MVPWARECSRPVNEGATPTLGTSSAVAATETTTAIEPATTTRSVVSLASVWTTAAESARQRPFQDPYVSGTKPLSAGDRPSLHRSGLLYFYGGDYADNSNGHVAKTTPKTQHPGLGAHFVLSFPVYAIVRYIDSQHAWTKDGCPLIECWSASGGGGGGREWYLIVLDPTFYMFFPHLDVCRGYGGGSESRVFCTTIFNCRLVFCAPIGNFSAMILPPRIVSVRVHRKELAFPPTCPQKTGIGGLHQWMWCHLGGTTCVRYDLSNVCTMWNGSVWGRVAEPSPER